MFIAALFITDKGRKPPKCPLTDKWIHLTNGYLAIKMNKVLMYATVWMNL